MLTLEELKDKIASTIDEITLIEMLNTNSEELVERFSDRIEERIDYFLKEVDEDGNEENEET